MAGTETLEKPAAKPKGKVFDVANPGKAAPSATSRPVMVANRPIMQDSMVSSADAPVAEPAAKPASRPVVSKIVLKPLSDEPAPVEADDVPAQTSAAKKSPEPASLNDVPEPVTEEEEEEVEGVEYGAETSGPVSPEPRQAAAGEPALDGQLRADDETAALEAAAKKQEAIETLVENHKYVLPIDSAERRRSRIVSILGVLLIVILGLLLLDLMLDAGFISIPGVEPVTSFFSV